MHSLVATIWQASKFGLLLTLSRNVALRETEIVTKPIKKEELHWLQEDSLHKQFKLAAACWVTWAKNQTRQTDSEESL